MNIFKTITTSLSMLLIISTGFTQSYKVLSEQNLNSDGPAGVETYTLIKSILGSNPIESPDLYANNHPGKKHIIEETDTIVGHHFTFFIHKDDDKDRDTDKTDRQRNEIKAYGGSNDELKAFNGESLRYHWYFQLEDGFSISKNFSHFFQLKAVGGNYDSQPVVTISGSINSSKPQFELIHSRLTGNEDVQLQNIDWEKANTGKWMEMEVIATYKDKGYLKITVKDLAGDTIIHSKNDTIDMWREGCEFVRPKWGIYRSLSSKQYLNDGEEKAHFADFTIQKITLNYEPTLPEIASNKYPFDGATYLDTSLLLQWNAGESASYHLVKVATDSLFKNMVLKDSLTQNQLVLKGLSHQKNYYWRVDEGNEDGITTGNAWFFSTALKASECLDPISMAVENIIASGEQDLLPKTNIRDNNLSTGWGFPGENQWITIDLGAEVDVNYLMLAFYKGHEKLHFFDIESSNNGTDYTKLASYQSTGLSTSKQKIILPETNTQYIRLTARQMLVANEPIIMEMNVYGCGGQIELPMQATLVYPKLGADKMNTSLTLEWLPGLGSETQRLYLGKSEPLSESDFISEGTDPFYEVSGLLNSETYYWRVDEVNEAGTTTGEVWNFSTIKEVMSLTIQEYSAGFNELDGDIENIQEGYTGEGYANSVDETDAKISWKVNAINDNYSLKWRYANGNKDDMGAFLKINDKAVAIIDFSSSEAWDSWIIDSIETTLNEGENIISLVALSDKGLANIDYFYIAGESLDTLSTAIIETTRQAELAAFPNPFQNKVSINYTTAYQESATIEVFDYAGKCVYVQGKVQLQMGLNQIPLDLNNLDKGMYLIMIESDSQRLNQKVIKE